MTSSFVADGGSRLAEAIGEQKAYEPFTWRGWWSSLFAFDYRLF